MDTPTRPSSWISSQAWLTLTNGFTSRYVANQLSDYLARRALPARPIEIISMGWPQAASHNANDLLGDEAILQKHDLKRGRYLLHVGTVEPRKNLGALFDALTNLLSVTEGEGLRCVLVGRDGWRSDAVRQRLKSDARLRDKVKWLKDANDAELTALYRGARFTVVPSFDEGWGLAVQESLAHGTPCIASPVGGILEAGLGLVEYVRCDNVNELTAAIRRYATDYEVLERARERIKRRLASPPRLPSWHDAQVGACRGLHWRQKDAETIRSDRHSRAPGITRGHPQWMKSMRRRP